MAASSEPRSSGDLDAAIGPHALAHAEPPLARHQLHRRRHAQVVAIVLQALAHLDDVAMAFGGQQADLGALVLEQRVGRDRRAVDDALGARPASRRDRCPSASASRSRPSITPSDWSAGVEAALAMRDAALRIDRHEIRERAADIDADPITCLSCPRPRRSRARRRARAPPRCAAAGSPQPPPPPEWASSTSPGGARCRSPWS